MNCSLRTATGTLPPRQFIKNTLREPTVQRRIKQSIYNQKSDDDHTDYHHSNSIISNQFTHPIKSSLIIIIGTYSVAESNPTTNDAIIQRSAIIDDRFAPSKSPI